LLKEIDFILSDISFKRIKPADFDALHLDRLNYYYQPLVDLARLFILHSTVELTHDRLQTFSFLFDMDEVFEQFIAGFIIKNKSKVMPSNSYVKYHDRSKYLVDLPKSLFMLEPDITITCNSRKLIIDTKYKVLDPEKPKLGVSQPDMYQCVAYALKHNCSDVVLLYPAHLVKSADKEPYIMRYDGKEIRIFVRTIDLSIDMQTQKPLIIDELKSVCDCLR
jgi:5-methylcytosine-specific restriction enzyme subunit McrC